jgi:hypothetical protein
MDYVVRAFTTQPIIFKRTNATSKETLPAGTKVLVSEKPMANGLYVARKIGTMLQAYITADDFTEVGIR